MHLGISSYTFPWSIGVPGYLPASPMDAANILTFAVDHHVSHVQFGDNLPLHRLSHNDLQHIVQYAQLHSLTLEVGTRGLRRENINTYIDIACLVDSAFIRVVIDDAGYNPTVAEVIATINDLLPAFSEKKKLLAIENHDRFSSYDLQRIVRETDEYLVGICLDTANSFGALEGTYDTVRILAPYAINLHIKDIRIERLHHKMGFLVSGAAAGKGMLDIPWIIDHVAGYGKCRSATIELWSGMEDTPDATITKEKENAIFSIQYLKQFLHE